MSTISTQFSYPAGVRPLLPAETVRRRRIESLILGELESAGYQEVIVPIVDFTDPYSDSQQRGVLDVLRDARAHFLEIVKCQSEHLLFDG